MEGITIHSKLEETDWRTLCMAAGARLADGPRRSWLDRSAPLITWLIITVTLVVLMSTDPPLVKPLGVFVLLAGIGGFWWFVSRMRVRNASPSEKGIFLGEQTFEFSAGGFRARRLNSDTANQWSIVHDVQETDSHIFLWIDRMSAYVLPARDLPAGVTVGAMAARIRAYIAASSTVPQTTTMGDAALIDAPASPAPADPGASAPLVTPAARHSPSPWCELRALCRLLGWKVVDRAELRGREITLALLGAVTLLLWIGLDRLGFEGDVQFAWWSLPSVATAFVAAMFLAWLLARFSSPRLELRQGMLLVLGLSPIFVLLNWLTDSYPSTATYAFMGVMAIEAVRYLKNGLRAMSGASQLLALMLAIASATLLWFGSERAMMMSGFWFQPEGDESSVEEARADQQLVFEQSSRIDALIAGMPARIPGKANVYFLGFAGYGLQKVFAQEIDLAERTVSERYGAQGRALQLVNDPRDDTRHPLASAPALRHALAGVALRMDVEQDLLFLSLSSHGSQDATISVHSESGVFWDDLAADDLASMLRESKIRWKIIVISACHAGSFIDALKDDGTIILTAAAADRTSFGCSDESELTYFGEAFYRDALPGAKTLRDAFMAARAQIATREQDESLTASDPQAFFGEGIAAKLAEVESLREP